MRRNSGADSAQRLISKHIGANAIVPPRDPHELKLFSIVKVRPEGSRADMIETTDTNLCEVLSNDEKKDLRAQVQSTNPSGHAKRLFESSSWSVEAGAGVQAFLEGAGFRAGMSNGRLVEIAVHDLAKEYVPEGCAMSKIEKLVHKHFQKLVLTTAFQNVIRKRFLIGIITGISTGRLSATTERSESMKIEATVPAEPVAFDINNRITSESRKRLRRDGIVGVNMVCFLVECKPKTLTCKVSKAVLVVQGDEDTFESSRKFLYTGRGHGQILSLRKQSKYLFAACHITPYDDDSLTEEERKVYQSVTRERGKIPAKLVPPEKQSHEQESEDPSILMDFAGVRGRDLWNLDGPALSESHNRLNRYFIATDPEGLQDVFGNATVPWMLECEGDLPE